MSKITHTFAIGTPKGGVGKTTTSLALSSGFANKGYKVLLIDIDPQANASKVLLSNYTDLVESETLYSTILGKGELNRHETNVKNLDIVPSHILLSDTDIELMKAMDNRQSRLKKQLEKVKSEYDYIFIDCPPALSWLTINAFTAADSVIAIVSPGYFELDSTIQLIRLINDMKEDFNPSLRLKGFLFTMGDNTNASKSSLSLLRQTYPNSVFNTIISRNTDVRDAHMNHQDVISFNKESKAAMDYLKLINELNK